MDASLEHDLPISLGVEQIDVEHRQIRRRVRLITAAVAEGRTKEVPGALRFLHLYVAEHFRHEEEWMAQAGYPGAREHGRGHAAILQAFDHAQDEARGDAAALSRAAVELAAAVDAHMRSEDVKLSRFFTARENLRLLAEAGPGVGAVLTPLPGSHAPVGRGGRSGATPYPAAAAVRPRTMK